MGHRVALTQAAFAQLLAGRLQGRSERACFEAPLELVARRAPGGGGRDQGEALDVWGVRDGVEHRQQPAPGVSGDCQAVQPPFLPQRFEVAHLLPPADRHVAPDWGAAATSLVVVDQGTPGGQGVEPGQEIVVVRARAAVEHDHRRPFADTALEERHPVEGAGEFTNHRTIGVLCVDEGMGRP
jgi:hypothetical protein